MLIISRVSDCESGCGFPVTLADLVDPEDRPGYKDPSAQLHHYTYRDLHLWYMENISQNRQRLNVAQHSCLRRILPVSYSDHVTNEEVHRRTATCPLNDIVTDRPFGGQTLCQLPHQLPKITIPWNPPLGRHNPGRPRTTWRRTFIGELHTLDSRSWSIVLAEICRPMQTAGPKSK